MKSGPFSGLGSFLPFLFRKDRLKLFFWLTGLISVTLATAAAYPSLYVKKEDLLAFVNTMKNPAMIALIGPGYGAESMTLAKVFFNEMFMFSAIAVAVMNIFIVGKATREDEEEGRLELFRSLPLGRLSYLGAAMLEALITNVILALMVGVGLFIIGLDGLTAKGAFLYGFLLAACGMVFAGSAALGAQLAETFRGAQGISFLFFTLTYLIRAIGDVKIERLSYLSPLGWLTRALVFSKNHWWPVFLSFGLSFALFMVAFILHSIRDLGAGFLPARRGRQGIGPFLKTPVGLLFRLQWGMIFTWSVIIFLLCLSFGSILGELEPYYSDMEVVQKLLGSASGEQLTKNFLALLISLMTLIGVVPALNTVLKILGEEVQNRLEILYSCPLSRTTMMAASGLWGILITVLLQVLVASGLWTGGAEVLEGILSFSELLLSSLVYLPAMWTILGLGIFFTGFLPKGTGAIWGYVAFCFIVVYLGDLLDFPDWLKGISFFHHVPDPLIEPLKWRPIFFLWAFSVSLAMAGWTGYRNRDISG